mmetsp:Transcript_763/g.1299  ORF Transcript_763/g.1299 Transcript_763/m.1299 type:complete len:270 (-) Transcript_763:218-1027(-)
MRIDHIVQRWLRKQQAPNTSLKSAQKLVKGGEFFVNGTVITDPKYQILPGVEKVSKRAGLELNGELDCGDQIFLVLNKPAGVISQRHPREGSVYDLIPESWRRDDLVAFGRLDQDTTGVLLFGTDGGSQSLLTHPCSRVWKTYRAVLADGDVLDPDASAAFETGITLDDGTCCAPARLEVEGPLLVRVMLHEGFFHQVKRMLAHVGGRVVHLHRESFGLISDKGLSPGEMRRLSEAECRALLDMLPLDRSTALDSRPVSRKRTCSDDAI